MNRTLTWLAVALVVLALASSIALLASDTGIGTPFGLSAATVPALSLLAVGLSFVLVQWVFRPRWAELLKNMLLAGTFLLWGVVQLMAQNPLSKTLGDVVVVLYVVDLAWTILAKVTRQPSATS